MGTKEDSLREAIEKAHNDGQTDASKGEYHNPYGNAAQILLSSASDEEIIGVSHAYDEGHAHTESQKSNCFLSTACIEHAGLTDNCRELTILRSFRDNYVFSLPNGPAVLAEYYEVAPVLVRQIEQSANRDRDMELTGIFATVTNAVELIEQGNYAEAFVCYETMFTELKRRYYKK